MDLPNYQSIFNCVSDYLPSNWNKVALYFAFCGNMISRKFYVDTGNGYVDCFNMEYDKVTLRQIFYSIEDILIEERKHLPKRKKWNVFTMFVYSTGKFDVNYDYEDISDKSIEYQLNWEKAHINNI